MKKLVAVALALVMLVTMALAVAEESAVASYLMVGVVDAEGNTLTVADTELPVLALSIDGASNKCAFGTEEETVTGTYEITGEEEGLTVVTVSLEDGSTNVLYYDAEEDIWSVYDEATGYTMVLMNVGALTE